MEGTKCHVFNKEGHWDDECPTFSPAEQDQRKKDRDKRWARAKKKRGQQHTQVGELIGADWKFFDGGAGDVENGFSMLAASKKNSSEEMQASLSDKKQSD